ncbi:MAG: biotin synthase BioB [Acaryochloridaceae cyanobacterium CSU_3_4]|nr:biotin synthase BioB [Acaryochloridaceae cyanobacterium CSU_3_4]
MGNDFEQWVKIALSDQVFPRSAALAILCDPEMNLLRLTAAAGEVRIAYFGRDVMLHRINDIQNGLCPEDCGYCAQSKISEAPIKKYPLKSEEDIIQEAHAAKAKGVYRYCMVSSGRGPTPERTQQLAQIIRRIKTEVGIQTCLSAGIMTTEQTQILKAAGLDRLNHNLNTSAAHTPDIVTTHTFQDRINTLEAARSAGLDLCSGMIVGMGETDQDIVEVAYTLRDYQVPSIPINFLIPIPGNPIYDCNQLTPQRCLRILCLFRFVNPKAEIRIGGGREGHLRGLQALALYPANSLFVEGYLATRGHSVDQVYQLIQDAGFEIAGDGPRRDNSCTPRVRTSAEQYQLDDNPNILNPKTTTICDQLHQQ